MAIVKDGSILRSYENLTDSTANAIIKDLDDMLTECQQNLNLLELAKVCNVTT